MEETPRQDEHVARRCKHDAPAKPDHEIRIRSPSTKPTENHPVYREARKKRKTIQKCPGSHSYNMFGHLLVRSLSDVTHDPRPRPKPDSNLRLTEKEKDHENTKRACFY